MYEFKLPDLGEGIHEGEILAWHVATGESVEEDAPLVDVETDKAAVTIPSPRGGKIVALHGAVGEIVEVGSVLAVIDDAAGEALPAAETGRSARVDEPPPPAPPRPGRPIPAAPATRRLARELGVALEAVEPTGPGGRVLPEDVRRLAEAGASPVPTSAPPSPARQASPSAAVASAIPFYELQPLPDFSRWGPIERQPIRSIRRTIARRMTTAKLLVPHVAHMDEADVTELVALIREERARRAEAGAARLTLTSLVARAATACLKAFPGFNASLDPLREEIVHKRYYHLGVAVDTDRGLIVPVVRDVDRKSVIEIAAAIEDIAARARDGRLEVDELRGGTFTITNIGAIGGTGLVPVINYPEVAILGMGRAAEKPVVRDGEIVVRTMLPLTLAFDHRVADGAEAARFVSRLAELLSDPRKLLLEA